MIELLEVAAHEFIGGLAIIGTLAALLTATAWAWYKLTGGPS